MSEGPAVHAPKTETFDLDARTNTDPKGFVRPVDEYRVTSDGLYLARPADHPRFSYVESWLLPRLGLRITDFHFTPGNEAAQEFYVDIVEVGVPEGGGDLSGAAGAWTTRDLYLDVICAAGSFTEVLDADEFAQAIAAGLLDERTAENALTSAFAASTGIAAHGHDLRGWLASLGIRLDWRRR